MKHWNEFTLAVGSFLKNVEHIDHMIIAPFRLDQDFETTTKRLKKRALSFHDKPFSDSDKGINYFIFQAKHELSEYMIDANKRELVIKKVQKEFESIHNRFDAVTKEWELNHVKHKATFYHGYFDLFQPVYTFYDWFLVEAELYKKEGKRLVKIENEPTKQKTISPKGIDYNKAKIKSTIKNITPDNVQRRYKENFNRYLYTFSDNVEINGELVNDRMKRTLMLFPAEDGKPNIKSATADGIRDGFEITELDFVESELNYITLDGETDFKRKKQINLYLDYLNEKVTELNREDQEPKSDNSAIVHDVNFPVDLFLEQTNYQLFVYLAQNYAKEKRPVDLSHIYRWMDELNLIAKRSGKKYRKFAVDNNFVTGKYSRMDDPSRDSRTPLNELRKAFDKSRS